MEVPTYDSVYNAAWTDALYNYALYNLKCYSSYRHCHYMANIKTINFFEIRIILTILNKFLRIIVTIFIQDFSSIVHSNNKFLFNCFVINCSTKNSFTENWYFGFLFIYILFLNATIDIIWDSIREIFKRKNNIVYILCYTLFLSFKRRVQAEHSLITINKINIWLLWRYLFWSPKIP